jgi:hypothetical protein
MAAVEAEPLRPGVLAQTPDGERPGEPLVPESDALPLSLPPGRHLRALGFTRDREKCCQSLPLGSAETGRLNSVG